MTVVSVALCTYNSARFIEEQLRSILDQTEPPAEVVLSDDGSSDDTLERARAVFAGSAVSLRIVGGETPLGFTRNFQRAVEACTGEIVVLSDHDDVWRRDRIETALAAFAAGPHLLLQHSDARLVDAQGLPLGLTLFEALGVTDWERERIAAGRPFEAYVRRNLVTGATALFRRELLVDALPFPPSWVHDEWLAIIAAATGGVQLLDETLIDYRQHGSNQIGVAKPTLRYRVTRMLEPRADRYVVLAHRASVLVERLERLGVEGDVLALARDKARFESVRAALPRRRGARVGAVLRELRAGSYDRLSSQGRFDVLRDLLQPA